MNYLISILSTALALSVLSGCGSSGGGAGAPASVGASTACPVGEWFSTNGNKDFFSVGNDNSFTMERVTSAASGRVICKDDQTFTLIIEAAQGNCPAEKHCKDQYPRDMNEITYFNVQGLGTYECSYSVASYTMSVRCTGKTYDEGNFFFTAKTYFLPGYY